MSQSAAAHRATVKPDVRCKRCTDGVQTTARGGVFECPHCDGTGIAPVAVHAPRADARLTTEEYLREISKPVEVRS